MRDNLKEDIIEIINNIPEQEKLTVVLYFYEELTLQEIALILKVSESRISQILNKTLFKIKLKVNEK